MTGIYECCREGAASPVWVSGFIDNATGQPATQDTRVALTWDSRQLIVRAFCHCGSEPVSMDDRLVVTFDPAGREADRLAVSVAPDGAVTSTALGTAFPSHEATWRAERCEVPVQVHTQIAADGWSAEVRLPFESAFALLGGVRPAAFRLNIGRIFAKREWSYWPLADGNWGEYPFAFGLVRCVESGAATAGAGSRVTLASPAPMVGAPEQRVLPFRCVMYDTSRGAIAYGADAYVAFVDWLAVCGCTHFMLYFEDGFRYESHPGFAAPSALTAADVQRIDTACHERGMELILAQTTFGHMKDVLRHPDTRHMAEQENPYQICPSHPDTYRFLGDLLDEMVPLAQSGYFNVNADESRLLGLCPRCRSRAPDVKGKEDLFLDHLLWLHDKVTSHGRRMMMWGDHLLGMPAVLDRLPKDVVVLDWHYTNWVAHPTLSFFREQGFDVVGCPWKRYDNLRRMASEGQRRGALGVMDTLWESKTLHLGVYCPGIYLMNQVAMGRGALSDEVLLSQAEQLIWPDHQPGLPWKVLFDRSGMDSRLVAKFQTDAVVALDGVQPDSRFAWLAAQIRADFNAAMQGR